MGSIRERIKRLAQDPHRLKRSLIRRYPSVRAVSAVATCRYVEIHNVPYLLKTFANSREGLAAWQRELAARRIFAEAPWISPIVRSGWRHILMPFYPGSARLDIAAKSMNEATRLKVARQAMYVLHEIFLRRLAHCDFHSRNLFWVEDQLYVIDFEHMREYPQEVMPPFRESYDLVGRGIDVPALTENMCYRATGADDLALEPTLGIPLSVALDLFEEDIS